MKHSYSRSRSRGSSARRRRNKPQPTRKRAICKRKVRPASKGTNVARKIQKNGGRQNEGGKQHSSLCVKTHSTDDRLESEHHNKITPDMIVDSLKELSYWRDPIPFTAILKFITDRFPVNPNLTEVEIELREKLCVAEQAGIVKEVESDRWRLCSSLERLRHIPETHLNLFWKLHCDTIDPLASKIKRKRPYQIIIMEKEKKEDSDSDLPSD